MKVENNISIVQVSKETEEIYIYCNIFIDEMKESCLVDKLLTGIYVYTRMFL